LISLKDAQDYLFNLKEHTEMADVTHQPANEASSRRPDNFIVGVIDEQPQVENAVNELNSLGFS
jgi:hypothetical protein